MGATTVDAAGGCTGVGTAGSVAVQLVIVVRMIARVVQAVAYLVIDVMILRRELMTVAGFLRRSDGSAAIWGRSA